MYIISVSTTTLTRLQHDSNTTPTEIHYVSIALTSPFYYIQVMKSPEYKIWARSYGFQFTTPPLVPHKSTMTLTLFQHDSSSTPVLLQHEPKTTPARLHNSSSTTPAGLSQNSRRIPSRRHCHLSTFFKSFGFRFVISFAWEAVRVF